MKQKRGKSVQFQQSAKPSENVDNGTGDKDADHNDEVAQERGVDETRASGVPQKSTEYESGCRTILVSDSEDLGPAMTGVMSDSTSRSQSRCQKHDYRSRMSTHYTQPTTRHTCSSHPYETRDYSQPSHYSTGPAADEVVGFQGPQSVDQTGAHQQNMQSPCGNYDDDITELRAMVQKSTRLIRKLDEAMRRQCTPRMPEAASANDCCDCPTCVALHKWAANEQGQTPEEMFDMCVQKVDPPMHECDMADSCLGDLEPSGHSRGQQQGYSMEACGASGSGSSKSRRQQVQQAPRQQKENRASEFDLPKDRLPNIFEDCLKRCPPCAYLNVATEGDLSTKVEGNPSTNRTQAAPAVDPAAAASLENVPNLDQEPAAAQAEDLNWGPVPETAANQFDDYDDICVLEEAPRKRRTGWSGPRPTKKKRLDSNHARERGSRKEMKAKSQGCLFHDAQRNKRQKAEKFGREAMEADEQEATPTKGFWSSRTEKAISALNELPGRKLLGSLLNEKSAPSVGPSEPAPYQKKRSLSLDFLNAIADESMSMPSAWPSNVVPYVVDPSFTESQRRNIAAAFAQYHDRTCVRFKPREYEPDYVFIRRAGENEPCTSNLGYQGGEQTVSLNDDCVQMTGTIMHELMHVLGFDHEQSRRDRDKFVRVNWDNIMPGYERNFHQRPQITDLSYDYGSIMHYPPYAFADRESVPTLVPTMDYPLKFIGQRMHLSTLDQSKINQIYRCDRHPVPPSNLYPTQEWRADSYMPDAEMKFAGSAALANNVTGTNLPLGNMGGHTPYLQEQEHGLILDDTDNRNANQDGLESPRRRAHGQGHYRCPHHKHFFQPW